MENNKLRRFLDWIERVGNRLPDPMMMFVWLITIILVLSAICSMAGLSAVNPANGETITVRNLLSAHGVRYFFGHSIKNFANFAPMAMVLVALIGSTVAEKSGLIPALILGSFKKSKGWTMTALIIMVGINANIVADAGIVIVPPLAAALYMAIGRRPVLGFYLGFGSVSAGFSSSFFLNSLDALLYGITEPAAQTIDPSYSSSIACNFYFMAASTILLTIGGTLLIEKILIKRFPVTDEQLKKYARLTAESASGLNDSKLALRKAGISALVLFVAVLAMCLPIAGHHALLAGTNGNLIATDAPFSKGLVLIVMLFLLVPGIVFGYTSGRYKNATDVRHDIESGFSDMGGYVFICFVISVFINYFAESNLGTIFAIKGAEWCKCLGLEGFSMLLCVLLLSAFINLFMGSASAKWAILAQIFVPMFMLMGYNPATAQVVYRIGDSITNPISPLFPYLPIILGTLNKYYKDAGIGTIVANMLPITATFFLIWAFQLACWFIFDLPLGPAARIFM